jgi:hypothetical protein
LINSEQVNFSRGAQIGIGNDRMRGAQIDADQEAGSGRTSDD